ncbi:MAG: PorV/PorQ family protein [Thermaurantimonas sp.]|uniref:PorV/PorQ family protein n=1 Tax=Thermaurantimonas sp. TaxID=2681568 RepID=UPI00391B05A2
MRRITSIAIAVSLSASSLFAGNPQRVGSAGANELLNNTWARNSGWGNVNTAGVRGVESVFLNIAGIANTENLEIAFTNTQWLAGSDITINSIGLVKTVGSTGALALSINNFSYGELIVRTEAQPDGGISTISPYAAIITGGYAQKFTESIFGGINLKFYNQGLPNLSVSALLVDAGVQYHTGEENRLKFGITLRNIGPSASFGGDGMSIQATVPGGGYTQTFSSRSAKFEFPSNLVIGGSYDFFLGGDQLLTAAINFQSNSLQKDEYGVGLEYAFRQTFMARVGYTIFDNRIDRQQTNIHTGLAAGISFLVPMSKESGSNLAFDYSIRTTRTPFQGTHSIGVRLSL